MMSNKKVHSVGKVPFSWENAPGVCKAKEGASTIGGKKSMKKLPPPPCPSGQSPRVFSVHDRQIPLPPCPFQTHVVRSSSKKGLREDPFLAAYMECTKSKGRSKKGIGGLRGGIGILSCKHSCGVREDGLVKMVHLPRVHHARPGEMVHPAKRRA